MERGRCEGKDQQAQANHVTLLCSPPQLKWGQTVKLLFSVPHKNQSSLLLPGKVGLGGRVWCSPWQPGEQLGTETEHLTITVLGLAHPTFSYHLAKFPVIPEHPQHFCSAKGAESKSYNSIHPQHLKLISRIFSETKWSTSALGSITKLQCYGKM